MEKKNYKNENMQRKFSKNTWHDWLINYIPEPIRKSVGGFKDVLEDLFKTKKLHKLCMGKERN